MNSIVVNVCGVVLTVLAVHCDRHDEAEIPTIKTSSLPFNVDNNCSNLTVYLNNLSSLQNTKTKYKICYTKTGKKEKHKCLTLTKDNGKNRISIVKKRNKHKLTSIYLEMETKGTDWCKNIIIFGEGTANCKQSANSENKYNKGCPRFTNCTVDIDLEDECTDTFTKKPLTEATTTTTPSEPPSTGQQSNQIDVLLYAIITVIVVYFIIMVIYYVKKYCHRNSDPIEAIELNTHATRNEILYADLSLAHGDSQPPRHEEEASYAKIIGVMKPVAGNITNK